MNKYLPRISNGFKINLSIFLLVLVFSVLAVNRAFIIGSLSAIVFLLFFYHKLEFNKAKVFIMVFMVALATTFVALLIKSDSTLGRLFIYKISWQMFTENHVKGIGFGEFQVKYGLYQAKYFENGNFTQKEFLLADNVFYAFNDYWQFICETGIIGIVILIVLIFFLVKISKKRIKQHSKSTLVALSISAIIVIGIASLFTHIMEKRMCQFILISSISYLVIYNESIQISDRLKMVVLILIASMTLVIQYYSYLIHVSSYYKFEKAKELSSAGYLRESNKIAKEIFPELKDDVEFLLFYSNSFFSKSNYRNRVVAYDLLLKKRTDYRIYLEQGRNYENLSLFKKAEQAYLTAVNMVPNRFQTRDLLVDFYIRMHEFKKAKSLIAFTLEMPVKVPSTIVEDIKKELRRKNDLIN